jgi:hypothetical protein
VLGQSFGGMCAVTYLSFAPHGVREAFITGGLPGLTATPDDVYRHTYRTVAARTPPTTSGTRRTRTWPGGWPTTWTPARSGCRTARR